jgi:hypothetical protein
MKYHGKCIEKSFVLRWVNGHIAEKHLDITGWNSYYACTE